MIPHRFHVHVCFTAAPALFSRVIRAVTGEPVSHVLVCYKSFDHNSWWVEEATEDAGAVISVPAARRLDYLERSLRQAYRLRLEEEQERRFLALFGASVGDKYDMRINLQLGAVAVGNRLRQLLRKAPIYVPRWPETRGRNCSEAAARVLRRFGLDVSETPTPGGLAAAMARWEKSLPEPPERLISRLKIEAPPDA